ncbi:MAG TPA: hypothetical protein P5094_01460 [Patescibacteria group bacterium]|nr:hypothetical protein [Patescibacteria group bacterium]
MRRPYFFIALVIIALAIAACSSNTARVEVGLDANRQQILAVDAKGALPAEDWVQLRGDQDWTRLQAYYLQKAQEATTPEASQAWLDLANQVMGQAISGTTLVRLVNASDYRIVVLDGPFAGIILNPGEASLVETRVPVGTLVFTVGWGNNQRATIIRQISAGQKAVVIVNK